jgi:hypothetical protein
MIGTLLLQKKNNGRKFHERDKISRERHRVKDVYETRFELFSEKDVSGC